MTAQTFTLISFTPIAQLNFTGTITRSAHQLSLHYVLQGDLSTVVIPSPAAVPTRRFALWEHTCFEFFLALPGDDRYWEFNLSPAGDWNVYRLDGYRQGLRDETAIAALPFTVVQQPQLFSLQLDVDLHDLGLAQTHLELAITAVIEAPAHEFSYWALNHGGPEADFHRRDGFAIALAAD